MKKLNILIAILIFIICNSQNRHIPIRVGNQFGIVDTNKNVIIPANYSFINFLFPSDYAPYNNAFIGYKYKSDTTDVIYDGKIIMKDQLYDNYILKGSIIEAQDYEYADNSKYISELYNLKGKRVNTKQYRKMIFLAETKYEQLMLLTDLDDTSLLAIYNKETEVFDKVIIRGIKYSNIPVFNSSKKIVNWIVWDNKSEYSVNISINKERFSYDTKTLGSIDGSDYYPESVETGLVEVSESIQVLDPKYAKCSLQPAVAIESADLPDISLGLANGKFLLTCDANRGLYLEKTQNLVLPIEYQNIYCIKNSSYVMLEKGDKWAYEKYQIGTPNSLTDDYFKFDKIPFPYGASQTNNPNYSDIILILDENNLIPQYYALSNGSIYYQP